jgi:hypothetical protein
VPRTRWLIGKKGITGASPAWRPARELLVAEVFADAGQRVAHLDA